MQQLLNPKLIQTSNVRFPESVWTGKTDADLFKEMAIGYESTATLISELLEIVTSTNRTNIVMQTNEAAIVFKP